MRPVSSTTCCNIVRPIGGRRIAVGGALAALVLAPSADASVPLVDPVISSPLPFATQSELQIDYEQVAAANPTALRNIPFDEFANNLFSTCSSRRLNETPWYRRDGRTVTFVLSETSGIYQSSAAVLSDPTPSPSQVGDEPRVGYRIPCSAVMDFQIAVGFSSVKTVVFKTKSGATRRAKKWRPARGVTTSKTTDWAPITLFERTAVTTKAGARLVGLDDPARHRISNLEARLPTSVKRSDTKAYRYYPSVTMRATYRPGWNFDGTRCRPGQMPVRTDTFVLFPTTKRKQVVKKASAVGGTAQVSCDGKL